MRKLSLTTVLIALSVFCIHKVAVTYSSVPPPGKTGAPGELSCVTLGCHPAFGNTGSISVTFNNGDTLYYPDSVYDIQITLEDSGNSIFGFQLTSLDVNEQRQGDLIVTNTSNTIISPQQGREYISHLNAFDPLNFGVDSHVWQFQWKAPPIAQDCIIFYFAGIAADGLISIPIGNFYMNNLGIGPTSINFAPVASDVYSTLAVDSSISIDLSVSAYDPNGDSLTYTFVTTPDSGSAVLTGPAAIQYVPNVGFIGQDSVIYSACDGGLLCDTGTIFFDVEFISGIESTFNSPSLRVYPNPFKEYTVIEFDNVSKEVCSFILFGLGGQIVLQIDNITGDKVVLQGNKVLPGIYLFQIHNSREQVGSGKLMIQ